MTDQTPNPLADVLAAHFPVHGYARIVCACHERFGSAAAWAAHVAAAIRALGVHKEMT